MIFSRVQTMKNQPMKSPEKAIENILRLAEMFPNCVTEGKNENGRSLPVVDFDLLKQELSVENWMGGGRTIQT